MGKGQEKGPSSGFSEAMLETYRECFRLMDIDRDGVINKNDLRAAFDNVGALMSEGELDAMLAEVGGTCSCDNLIKCLEAKMAGGTNDSDDLIIRAFKCYDEESSETVKGVTTIKHLIDSEKFRHVLMTFGDKMTQEEIDDVFAEFDFDEDTGFIQTKSVVDLFVSGGMDEKDEKDENKKNDKNLDQGGGEEDLGGAEASSLGENGASDGSKKKKKKKKAAK